ncbi:kinase-like domain-containing protein [Rhypophila decipiens]|uniref:Kinase-like domain-containing protein n=1 Tax=Rhypophila decipiens TaxID=261697 RepID=A0AAN6YBY7_9PEZI|nr:kinase-like domain-containing protein [Rhypophila decipiens]
MPDLYYRITKELVARDPNSDENSLVSKFLPHEVLVREITPDSIAAKLSWFDWFRSRWSNVKSPPFKIHCQAPKVFATLVLIGQESAIVSLVFGDDIHDGDLPLCLTSCEKSGKNKVRSVKTGKEFPSFGSWLQPRVDEFLQKQWIFLAPFFQTGEHLVLTADRPLPITQSSLVKAQGTRVFIHKARFHHSHAPFAAPGFSLAIKEFRDKPTFLREKEILDMIQDLGTKHLIRLLASYQTPSSCCLVFKWAEGGNLEDFWRRESSTPRTPGLTIWFLQQIVGLVEAVSLLYEKNIRHGDIKPLNVLHFIQDASSCGTLVLADVGISKHHYNLTGLRCDPTMTRETTIGYEAPEAENDHPDHDQPRSRRYDSWPMGCMLLEFTVWLLYGYEAVDIFRKRRTTKTRTGDYSDPNGAFFKRHTMDLHPAVERAFVKLRADPRCGSDTARGDLLNLVKTHLLQVEPKRRLPAPDLHLRLSEILQKAVNNPSYLGKETDSPIKAPDFFRRSTKDRTLSDASKSSVDSSISFT